MPKGLKGFQKGHPLFQNKTQFKKGHVSWLKGTKGIAKAPTNGFVVGQKINLVPKPKNYKTLHKWVGRTLGRPSKCEFCGRDGLSGKYIHWANKSRKYLKEISDWLRLCAKCHFDYDKRK